MPLPTLDEFLVSALRNGYIRCRVAGITYTVYIRKGQRIIDGVFYKQVLDIGNIRASRPGTGAFPLLLDQIRGAIIPLGFAGIYVESVLNDRFAIRLEELGFLMVNLNYGTPNYWKSV